MQLGLFAPCSTARRLSSLFQVIANCYERRSVAITTNLEFGQVEHGDQRQSIDRGADRQARPPWDMCWRSLVRATDYAMLFPQLNAPRESDGMYYQQNTPNPTN